ncbi:MAG: hypothetical protein GQF41_1162 [Candidatus Rifleibacterium amylolyticum]|nr:MAG: hypothetical protein GQF41_1162 [Candidatus Rifleibacterium amylolyticum]
MYIFRSRLFISTMLLIFMATMMVPAQLFAQTASREKSGAEIFLKWFTIGAMVVGAGVGVATFGVAGLVLGPVIGAAAATLTGILFQANPVDQWRAVVNKPPRYSNSNIAGMAVDMASERKTEVRPGADMSPQDALAAYRSAYSAYEEAVKAGDQTDIAKKAAAVRDAKSAYNKALGR